MKTTSKLALILAIMPRLSWGGGVNSDNHTLVKQALENQTIARNVCAGISDEISKIAGQSVANVAITSVGTVAGAGAVAAGIAKSREDKRIEELMRKICALTSDCSADAVKTMTESDMIPVIDLMAEIADIRQEIAEHADRSRKLGNWRTGLMAGGAATGVASAILAGINADQSDLIQHVSACNIAINKLREMYSELLDAGINPIDNYEMQSIRSTTNACNPINVSDIDKIETRMKAVMGTGIGTAAVDIAGAITSGTANSQKGDSAAGAKKGKNLNTAANVMAGVGTASSLVGTGVNISLITLTKKLISQAKQCEEAL